MEQRGDQELTTCYEIASGRLRWSSDLGHSSRNDSGRRGPPFDTDDPPRSRVLPGSDRDLPLPGRRRRPGAVASRPATGIRRTERGRGRRLGTGIVATHRWPVGRGARRRPRRWTEIFAGRLRSSIGRRNLARRHPPGQLRLARAGNPGRRRTDTDCAGGLRLRPRSERWTATLGIRLARQINEQRQLLSGHCLHGRPSFCLQRLRSRFRSAADPSQQ